MNFRIEHTGNYIDIIHFHHNEDEAKNGNPYNTFFQILVKSNSFGGVGDCEIDIIDFKKFAKQIVDLYDFKVSKVELNDIRYGSVIEFEMLKTGQLEIKGTVYADCTEHSLQFHFEADQTSLKSFAENLKRFL